MRLKTPTIKIGMVKIGHKYPIAIQSMTNTETADTRATARQCIKLAEAGSEMVRLTVNNNEAAAAIPKIRETLNKKGFEKLPLIGDFHFNGHRLLTDNPDCAKLLDKYRINPGNIGYGKDHEKNFAQIMEIAYENGKPVRIGANFGSLDQELLKDMMDNNKKRIKKLPTREVLIDAMVKSTLDSAKFAQKLGIKKDKLVLSVKMSSVQDCIDANIKLASKMLEKDNMYAIHVGLTEAGGGIQGLVSSSAAMAILLNQGIGDTIRMSLTPLPTEERSKEVQACKTLLQSMEFRHFQPKVTSCPGCGRTDSTLFMELASQIDDYITGKMPEWSETRPDVSRMKVAVMGCVVNGPGESRHADIGISLPGKNEKTTAPVFIKGKQVKTLSGNDIAGQFIEILEKFVNDNY